jgi:uncharacterized protein YjiK
MMGQFIQTKCPVYLQVVLLCTATVLISCKQQSYTSPAGYDFRTPQKLQLGKVLNEISGINYNNENSTILAISDSKEKIFEMNVKNPKLKDYSDSIVANDADLEDIVKVDETVYLLSSKGTIYEVNKGQNDSAGITAYPFWSTDQNDFETIYHDASANGLVMICKTCPSDKGKQIRSAYRFDLATKRFDSSAFFGISTAEIRKVMKDNNVEFDPSAAMVHPINKRLYILSSAGNALVIADTRGKVIEGYHLNPDDHPQAEGLTFSPNGDMYISNEGKFGKPTLQIFHYQGNKK